MLRYLLALFLVVPALPATPTFNSNIAPLVYTHCAPCHHPGGIGPFPLLSIDDLRKHSSQIVAVTASRYMPPWPPAPGVDEFLGDRHLTASQIQLIADWVKGGTPVGASPSPTLPAYTNEWQMGQPDLILRMPKPFEMPAASADIFRNFIVPSGLSQTRFIRGFELRLNNKRAVHHANVVLDRNQSLRHRDGEDGKSGFPGMDVTTEAAPNDFEPDSHFLFWKPASALQQEPEDMSWRLDPDTDLILNLHLQPTGKPESIQAEIGLYFAASPPTRKPMLLQLENDGALHIPPGDRRYIVEDHLRLPVDVDLLAIYPHAHYLGKVIQAWAVRPNGQRQDLIHIPDWDINWQATYEYRHPIFLPKGTVVAMKIQYDNSASNPRNPSHPPVLVETGNRSRDEMGHVWLQVLPRVPPGEKSDPRVDLQEAAMTRRLEKYPSDFLAHYNLGALLQARGNLPAAADAYQSALRLEPKNSTALNALAGIYMLQEKLSAAIPILQEALAQNPGYLNARYNLAVALADAGDLHGAAAEYEAFVTAKPDDMAAQRALAAIFVAQKNYSNAAEHLRAAVKTNPNDSDLQVNLGAAEALSGHLQAAVQAFESALRLNPDNTMARRNLARAQAALVQATH